ncbi:M23 family metallopeptidase [Streptomyces sp. NPDC050804]|uniref:M23 family metallopeptidase n=1 Tax=Streptomyces sp. NPDC050804 TaxID=3154745 RepID=UPI00342E424A
MKDGSGGGFTTLAPHTAAPSERPWGETPLTRQYVIGNGRPSKAPSRRHLVRGAAALSVVLVAAVGVTVAVADSGTSDRSAAPAPVADGRPATDDAERPADRAPGSAPEAAGEPGAVALPEVSPVIPDAAAQVTVGDRIREQAEQQQIQADVNADREEARIRSVRIAAQRRAAEVVRAARARTERAREKAQDVPEAGPSRGTSDEFVLPLASYTITSTFGDKGALWSSGRHTGLDFAAPTGKPLRAIGDGTVADVTTRGAFGNRTVLRLDDGTELWFCHQDSTAVTAGQKVRAGEVIGTVGATGNVTGPHLHLEVHAPGGAGIDPMVWLAEKGLSL